MAFPDSKNKCGKFRTLSLTFVQYIRFQFLHTLSLQAYFCFVPQLLSRIFDHHHHHLWEPICFYEMSSKQLKVSRRWDTFTKSLACRFALSPAGDTKRARGSPLRCFRRRPATSTSKVDSRRCHLRKSPNLWRHHIFQAARSQWLILYAVSKQNMIFC